MGANQTTFVPGYVSGEVLTAARLNVTNSGAPVFADSSARDAAFGGTGEKTLAEGQLCYLEDADVVQYYDGSSWASVGGTPGLAFVSSTTIGSAVSSVTVSGAFSATYDNYAVIISGGVGSSDDLNLLLKLGSVTNGFYYGGTTTSFNSSAVSGVAGDNAATFRVGGTRTGGLVGYCLLTGPFLSATTGLFGILGLANGGSVQGIHLSTTSFTAFTISLSSGTMTGGTIKVYGYKN